MKPTNIIVGDADDCVLVDCSIESCSLTQRESVHALNNIRYQSPERLGLIKEWTTESSSDVFSIGCIFFECLNRKPFFHEDEINGVLRQHLEPRSLNTHKFPAPVPELLVDYLQKLLAESPLERYQSFAAALDDFEMIAAFHRDSSNGRTALASTDFRSCLTDPSFVGRESEIVGDGAIGHGPPPPPMLAH